MAVSHNLIEAGQLVPGTVVLSCGRDFHGTQGIESFARAYGLSSPPPTYVAVAPREEYHEQYFVYSVPEGWQPGRPQFPLGRSALSIWTSQSPSIPAALSNPQTTAYAPKKLEATIPELPRPGMLPELPPDWLHALTDEALRAKNDSASPRPVESALLKPPPRVLGGLIALTLLLVGFVLWQGGAFDPANTPAAREHTEPSTSMSTTEAGGTENYSTSTPTASALTRELNAVGITESLIQQLQTTASATNYGLRRNVPLERENLEDLAYVMILACADIAVGTMTWQESVDADIGTGASRRDAETMNRFLRTSYCPAIDYAALPN